MRARPESIKNLKRILWLLQRLFLTSQNKNILLYPFYIRLCYTLSRFTARNITQQNELQRRSFNPYISAV